MSQSGSNEVSLTEAGWHVGGGSLLLLYDKLVSNRAEALVAGVAVEAAPVLAQGGVVLFHIPIPAVYGQGKCETMGVCYSDTQSSSSESSPTPSPSPSLPQSSTIIGHEIS